MKNMELTNRELAIIAMSLRSLLETTCRTAPCGPQHLTTEALLGKIDSLLNADQKKVQA